MSTFVTGWWDLAVEVALLRHKNTGRKYAVRWDATRRLWTVRPAVVR